MNIKKVTAFLLLATTIAAAELPEATAKKLPRWRGFNLLEKFHLSRGRRPFLEEDFKNIHELGFNFVRLPMDYRFWIADGDWTKFDEKTLKEIDRAVEFGKKYSIHVSINFHRAPGYTVARPREKLDLFKDAEARRVCALHWATFAKRYEGIPSRQLSFNLLNEPAHVSEDLYAEVAKKLVDAIRAEDPRRLILADGRRWGREPSLKLVDLGIGQMTRGYDPMNISHFRAGWINGSDAMPTPAWPMPKETFGMIYGPGKKELHAPLRIEGDFTKPAALRMHVGIVSSRADLVVKANGKIVWEKVFACGPGKGEWKKAVYKKQWKIYQNLYDRDYTAKIPAGTGVVELSAAAGDWISLTELGLCPEGGKECTIGLSPSYGKKPGGVKVETGDKWRFVTEPMRGKSWLWDRNIKPWKDAESKGVGVMVGEWGAFNRTPHDVVLRWMEDCLENWREAGWGWALWNFRGPFGILNSGREDVEYEEWRGHKLDRKMLDLLQGY